MYEMEIQEIHKIYDSIEQNASTSNKAPLLYFSW